MKLTNKDKNYLLSIGYTNEDFTAIEDVTKNIKYLLAVNCNIEIKLNQKQVIDMLGRNNFLSGISRATFHNSAMRWTEHNMPIFFERKKF
jgi:hypothetical protein